MDSVPVQPGQVLAGRYVVEHVLGSGGMGVVVSAVHQSLGERVAIKFLLDSAAQPSVVERFLREARAAARLRSEYVARVTDVGTLESGAPYMIMEFLQGNDAAAELEQRGALPIAEAIDYVLQACEALAEAHSLGIVHRDVKPANLFLAMRPGGSRIVKVIDFGIAKSTEVATSLTLTQSVIGSPLYMSPEQIRNAKTVDARSDVWSLGVTCYELLSGHRPFSGETLHGTLASIVADAPIPLRNARPDAPAALEAALARCLVKDRDQRYASVAELARALSPFGSSRAARSVEQIESVLGARSTDAQVISVDAISSGAPTVPFGVMRPVVGARTEEGWTRTSAGPRRRLGKIMLAGAGIAGILGILGVVAARFSTAPQHVAEMHSGSAPNPSSVAPERPALSSVSAESARSASSAPLATVVPEKNDSVVAAPVAAPRKRKARPAASVSVPASSASSAPLTIEGRKF